MVSVIDAPPPVGFVCPYSMSCMKKKKLSLNSRNSCSCPDVHLELPENVGARTFCRSRKSKENAKFQSS